MPGFFTHTLDTPTFKGTIRVNTGLFINGEWVNPAEPATIDVVNPVSGDVLVAVDAGSSRDVDLAVVAAKRAYDTIWGLKTPGAVRGKLLNKLADLMEMHIEELVALEVLDVGKAYSQARQGEIPGSISTIRYFAGWADKIQGKTIEVSISVFLDTAYVTICEILIFLPRLPKIVLRILATNLMASSFVSILTCVGILITSSHNAFHHCFQGQIIPWNFPTLMIAMKIGPALAAGNTIVLKPSEVTPLSALRMAELIAEAGFPPGVVNIINGYGSTVGEAISHHPNISKIAFTGSTLTGRRILTASAASNLKDVTLELGGKSPTIIFDDADLEQTIKWVGHGIYLNMGQCCTASSRIFVQAGIYDIFLEKFIELTKAMQGATGDPFQSESRQGPLVSQAQFDRVMSYIASGKREGATVLLGGERHGDRGFFVQPTVFKDVTPSMQIMREEIFGPVSAVMKFDTEEEVIQAANDTTYGLACNIFTENTGRAIRVAHAIEAGTAWVNCSQIQHTAIPFGGYKQSGIGREFGEHALETYTQVKAVHMNHGIKL